MMRHWEVTKRAGTVAVALILGACRDQSKTMTGPTDSTSSPMTAAAVDLGTNSHWTVDEVDLGSLGLFFGDAMDVNNRGAVTGWSQSPVGAHTFVWHQGVGMTDIDPNGPESVGVAINNLGHVAGYFGSPPPHYDAPWTGPHEAYFWNGVGAPIRLGIANSWVTGMNDDDEIVGMANGRPFYWAPRTGKVRLAPPEDPFTGGIRFAADINQAGSIATTFYRAASGQIWVLLFDRWWRFRSANFGSYQTEVRLHAMNASGATVGANLSSDPVDGRRAFYNTSPVPAFLGGLANEALGVNDQGAVVGWSEYDRENRPGQKSAFAWQAGIGLLKLHPSQLDQSVARAVNQAGWIVGSYICCAASYPRLWIVRKP